MFDLKKMTLNELAEMRAVLDAEMAVRENERFRELTSNACKALEALRAEFPNVSYIVEIECPGCDETMEYDLFEEIPTFFATDFKP